MREEWVVENVKRGSAVPDRGPVHRPFKQRIVISFFVAIGLLVFYRILFNESAFGPAPHYWTAIIYIPLGVLILMGVILGVWYGSDG